ncbi:MAG: DUF433 domain-containing protein [Anaerolineales bacterium]
MASDIALNQLIAITPGICGGKPRIAGRRISVEDVALWHERLGLSSDQIAIEFGLTLAEVHAALAYYFAHREEVEASIQDGQSLVEAVRRANPSLVKQRLRGE